MVLESLNGVNYQSWSKQILMALDVKNKTGFVDGTILPPSAVDSPKLYAAWKRPNALVLVWLYLLLHYLINPVWILGTGLDSVAQFRKNDFLWGRFAKSLNGRLHCQVQVLRMN